ncbi:hypothetical protein AB0D04_09355 [Streptomyces sp. NPDC048483]|uniref:hypothetical protein n=1 Tax=Streptomyces sp. NPDC048483 TaxID=3154927 RepID=UPI00342F7B96
MRKAAQIAGAAAIAAMLLSGCGSSGDKGSDSAPSKAPESGPSTPGGGDKPADGKAFEGAWKAGSADSPLVLGITQGTVVFAEGHKTACVGKIQEMGGMTMAALKCTKGDDKTRTMGALKPSSDGKTLTVSWKNGPTEKYTKSTDGSVKIPDMPKLPSMPSS